MNRRIRNISIFILLLLLYCPFFLHLSHQPFRIYDEVRQAFNAYEMHNHSNVIVTTYGNNPDMWNLKPPLLVWCQCFLMKIFGPWELAVRLPVAISGFLTALVLFFFAWRYCRRFWLGIIAAVLLSTIQGYIDFHGARTGDYDVMVTFFSTCYVLLFFLFFETGKTKFLYAAMAGVTLAVMTKGIAGLLFIPSLIVVVFFYKKFKDILMNKHFYFSFFIFLTITGGYYMLREYFNPGYLKAVMVNEWGGRYLDTIEGHKEDFWFYFNNIKNWHFHYWILFIPCGFVFGIVDSDNRFRRFAWYISGFSVLFWLIISLSETKLIWYIYQIIPLLSMLAAIFIYNIFRILEKIELHHFLRRNIVPYIFLFLVMFPPYKDIFMIVYNSNEDNMGFNGMSYYLRNLAKDKITLNEPLKIIFDGCNDHLQYYIVLLSKEGKNVAIIEKEKLKKDDLVMCSQEQMDKYLQDNFSLDQVGHYEHVSIYRISGRKNS